MKVWRMTCDACHRPGPAHENPIESIRLAEDQGWGPIEMGVIRINVCPECRAEPERAFKELHSGKPTAVQFQSSLP